jgi:hypothetical protein
VIRVRHSAPGRVRLGLWWLQESTDEAASLAEALARLEGVIRVTARPFTGSVLCEYDPTQTGEDAVLEAVRAHTRVQTILRPGERAREDDLAGYERIVATEGTTIARALARTFRRMNLDVVKATDGWLDIGTVATLAFFSAGFVEVARTRRLSAPPWFNLAWWAFRTFTEVERKAIASAEPLSGPGREGAKKA